jgi:hypothetical protein
MIIRNIAVSCCLVFICFPIYSQKFDSLKALVEIKTDLDRADVLYELSYNYIELDNNIALITVAFLIFLYLDYRRKRDLNIMLDQKIKERTRELESSRDELMRAVKEQDLRIHRASKDFSETMSTIKGLCVTGMIEVTDPTACSYMKMIDKSFVQLVSSLDRFSGIRHQRALH